MARGSAKPAIRATTLATFDEVVTVPETVCPGWATLVLSDMPVICGGAFGASIGTAGGRAGTAVATGVGGVAAAGDGVAAAGAALAAAVGALVGGALVGGALVGGALGGKLGSAVGPAAGVAAGGSERLRCDQEYNSSAVMPAAITANTARGMILRLFM